MQTIESWWMWLVFFILVGAALCIDMFAVGNQKAHKVSIKEALTWSGIWASLAIVFDLGLWWYLTHTVGSAVADTKALEFLTGYILELSLSVDNVFVFLLIFTYFAIPPQYQRRILLYGILGAIIMRLSVILFGIYLVTKFHWILYIFGIFLAYTGAKMLLTSAENETDLSTNPLLKWMRNHLRITHELHAEHFFIRKEHLLYVTPLFVVLVLIEISDLIFATDSIPAIFAVTTDPFIVFTSNIFAILGLRALYFLFVHMSERFHLLQHGVAIILMFVGAKMLLAHWYKISILVSLSVIISILVISVLTSIWHKKKLNL